MIKTLHPNFILVASHIPSHKQLFNFAGITLERGELGEDEEPPLTLSAWDIKVELTYEMNGNLITGDGKYREYNEFNQLVRVRAGYDTNGRILEEYLYHPTEERILAKKVYDFDQHLVETIIYVNDNLVRKINASGTYDTVYVKDEIGLVAEKKPNGGKLFYHDDHLGSTTLITNESGGVVENTFYEPYGGILSGGTTSRFDYEGKEFSSGTSDYDFHFRKYDSGLKVFTQPDNLLPNKYDPQELNKYSFEKNNPWKNKDETGHDLGLLEVLLLVIGGYLVGQASLAMDNADREEAEKEGDEAKVLEANLAFYTDTVLTAAGIIKVPFLKEAGDVSTFKTLIDMLFRFKDTQPKGVHFDTRQVIDNVNHVTTNQNLNPNIQSSVIESMVNTEKRGEGNIVWYYSPKKGQYQWWYGSGRPSNPDYVRIGGGGRSGGGSRTKPSGCRATGNAKCP